jgi:type II secretory pathway pseudopilin PulG
MIEVILAITVMGILAVTAFPNFVSLTDEAHIANRDNVAAAVQTSIELWRVNDIMQNGPPGTFPAQLDAQPNGSDCVEATPCFGAIMLNAITDPGWTKVNGAQYQYDARGTIYTYNYDVNAGTFMQ